MPRENPYTRLKRTAQQWIADNVLYRRPKVMCRLDLKKKTYELAQLADKIETADRLGYTVELTVDENGCVVFTYVKKLPTSMPIF